MTKTSSQRALMDLGFSELAQKMSTSFPYLELRSDGGELAKCFGGYRPKLLVDLNFHNAFEALVSKYSYSADHLR